jgi:arsenate reductase
MAEGWARHLKSDVVEAYSAGTKPHGLNRVAVKVMMQAGVDISEHGSKKIARLSSVDFDYVVTVCDNAQESCPIFPGDAKVIHKGFDDPPRLAEAASSDEEAMGHYSRVRDEIRAFIETIPESLHQIHAGGETDADQLDLGI